jgi:hypothetical protein
MKLINQNSKARENMTIDEYWLIGFTEGDATFSSNKLKPKIKYDSKGCFTTNNKVNSLPKRNAGRVYTTKMNYSSLATNHLQIKLNPNYITGFVLFFLLL